MDRLTGKTMDCYVEFFSYGDAQAALNKCLVRGSQLRLGDRVVDVSLSSQDELLRELFPRAKNCMWQNGRPKILESNEPYNTGFKTFITNEELLQLVSHAEKPHRVSSSFLIRSAPFFPISRVHTSLCDSQHRSLTFGLRLYRRILIAKLSSSDPFSAVWPLVGSRPSDRHGGTFSRIVSSTQLVYTYTDVDP